MTLEVIGVIGTGLTTFLVGMLNLLVFSFNSSTGKRIDNLRTDVGKVRTEFQAGMKETRTEFQAGMKETRTDMNEMRAEFQAGMKEIRTDMKEMRADMKEMLKAIHEVSERVARLEEHKVMERGSGVVVGIPGQTMAPAPQRMRTSTP